MTRTHTNEKGTVIIEEIYRNELIGIGFMRNTGFSNDTIASWCKRLLSWKKIRFDTKGKIQMTEQGKAEFEQRIPLPIDHRKREIEKIEKIRIEPAKGKEQQQKRLLLTAAIAASNSRYFRRVGNIQAGDVGINDTISKLKGEQKIFDYRSYELPGVGVTDIVNKPPHSSSRIEYRPNKIKPLKFVCTYVIGDPLLKDFIDQCLVMLSNARERMNLAWVYGKQINGKALEKVFQEEYLKWFTNIYGNTRIKSTHFTYLNVERKKLHNQPPYIL